MHDKLLEPLVHLAFEGLDRGLSLSADANLKSLFLVESEASCMAEGLMPQLLKQDHASIGNLDAAAWKQEVVSAVQIL